MRGLRWWRTSLRTPSLHRCGGVYQVSHGDVATNPVSHAEVATNPDPESPPDDEEDDEDDQNYAKTRENQYIM